MAKLFSGKRIRLCIYITGIITIYSIPISFIESRSFCLWYNLLGKKCFGCGMTRSFFNLSRFKILKAIDYNFMIVFMIIPTCLIIKDMFNILRYELKKLNKKLINKRSM